MLNGNIKSRRLAGSTQFLLIIFGRSLKQFEGDLGDLRVKDLTPRTESAKTLADFWVLLVGKCRKRGILKARVSQIQIFRVYFLMELLQKSGEPPPVTDMKPEVCIVR